MITFVMLTTSEECPEISEDDAGEEIFVFHGKKKIGLHKILHVKNTVDDDIC